MASARLRVPLCEVEKGAFSQRLFVVDYREVSIHKQVCNVCDVNVTP